VSLVIGVRLHGPFVLVSGTTLAQDKIDGLRPPVVPHVATLFFFNTFRKTGHALSWSDLFPRAGPDKFDDWVDAWSQAAGALTSGVDYSMFTSRLQVILGMRIIPPGMRPWWQY